MGKELLNSDKELLLIDLCARLPYGVKALFFDVEKEYISIIEGIDIYKFIKDDSGMESEISDIKPYLFPLSSMTEEQKEEIDKITNGSVAISENFFYDLCNCSKIYHFDVIAVIDWLNKNHFDYRGLIPMGLAIDATGLSVYN